MFFNCAIILASNSPRRKELLKLIFDDYKVVNSDIDEEQIEKELSEANFTNNLEKFQKICEEKASL